MPNADRAAVAREGLTEYADILRDAGQTLSGAEVRRYVREHSPAPPAPETVTVTFRDGSTETLSLRDGKWQSGTGLLYDELIERACLDRIASDARALKERDARIAELETQLQRALDGAVFHEKRAHHAEQERDAALRALERERAANDTRIEYGTEPRGVVISGTLEEVKGEAGATVAASEPLASESPAATSPSPDPIPLGETVTVDGAKWARTELGWNGGAWRYHDSSTVARVLTALYRARHPVATRETVERVAKAIDDADSDSLCPVWDVMTVHQKSVLCDMARAALTAAGFTLEEGA